jgi:TP901 family phage tail tape measure protein
MADKDLKIVISAIDKATAPIKELGKTFDNLWDNLRKHREWFMALWVGAGIATAGIIAGIKTSTDAFAEFEATMSGVKAVLAPTTKEFEDLNKKARELWKTTNYTAKQAADATEMLAKNGLTSKQILEGALDATISLAASTGAELSKAADISSSAMLIFWKEAKDLWQVINSITGTTNVSKFGIEDYANALAQGWWVAKTVGVNFKDFNTSIAAISSLFNSGEDAGTSFKTFLLRLVPSSKEARQEMEWLWLITKEGANQFFDASGKMKSMSDISEILRTATKWLSDEQKNATLNTIFGTDALRAASWIAETGAQKFNEMQKAIENTSATENARIRMDNLKGATERMNGAINELQLTIWETFNPILVKLYDNLWPIISKFSDFIAKNPVLFSNLTMVAGGVLWVVTALTALWFIMWPIGLAMWALWAIITPLLAILALLWWALYLILDNWNIVWPQLIKFWEDGKKQIEEIVLSTTASLKDFWKKYGDDITLVMKWIWLVVYGAFILIKSTIESVMWIIWPLIQDTLTVIGGAFQILIGILTLDFAKAWQGVQDVVSWVVQVVWDIILAFVDLIARAFGTNIVEVVTKTMDWLKIKAQETKQLVSDILASTAKIWQSFSIQWVVSAVSGGTDWKRALWWPVYANRSYLVWENWPEIFSPGSSGKINNNPSGGWGNITINLGGVTVQNSADEDRLVEKIRKVLIRETQLYSNGIA